MSNGLYIITTLFLLIFTLTGNFKYLLTLNEKVNTSVQQCNIDNATDYAMFSMLANTEDLKADYASFGSIEVDPQVGYDSFIREYAFSQYGSNSNEAMNRIKSDFIVGLALVYDGYYVFDKESNISLKIPYIYEETISLDKDAVRYNVNLTKSTLRTIDPNTGITKTAPIEASQKNEIIKQLESTISKEINIKIQNHFYKDELYQVYTPFFRDNLSGTQGIDSISLIFVMDNDFTFTNKPVISISGSRVVLNRFCLGYDRGSERFYTWLCNYEELKRRGISPKKMFKNKQTAAKLGYNYDVWLQYDINK